MNPGRRRSNGDEEPQRIDDRSEVARSAAPTEAPTISVIVCTWNRCETLREMLQTLERQEIESGLRVEVLVVDNNSHDDTAEMVRELASNWRLGALRYLYEARQGKQFALNLGIRHARADLLAFTDDDVALPANWLQEAVRLFGRANDVQLAGGKTLPIWPQGEPPAWFRPSMRAVVAAVDAGDTILSPAPDDFSPAGTNMIARRSLFDAVGMFSETHFRHMDYEFGQRARRSGALVVYSPDLVVHTGVSSRILEKRYFRRWYFKLGIASAMHVGHSGARLLGVPRWIWRQLLDDGVALFLATLRGGRDQTFERELRFLQLGGHVASVAHRRLRPGRHDEWVRRWSQKQGEVFR